MSLYRRGVAALEAAAASISSTFKLSYTPLPSTLLGMAGCFAAALILLISGLVGFAAPLSAAVMGAGALAVLAMLLLFRDHRGKHAQIAWRIARPILLLMVIPLGFYLIERPWNESLLFMEPSYVMVNLGILAALFALVYLAGQRTRAAVTAFLAACLIVGVANHFVIAFKGQPMVPADLFALSTAASVSSGYTLTLDERLIEVLVVFAGANVLLAYIPKVRVSVAHLCVNTALAVAVGVGFGWWLSTYDLEETYDCTVDVWSVKESYAEQGTMLCFLKRTQDLNPEEPVGYNPALVEELLALHSNTEDVAVVENQPTVIVVMNETFSDLSRYPGLANTEARPAAYYDIAAAAIEAGEAYVSALGGGTCNSEFEFLTGSSMGYLGGGVYPYVLYDLDHTESLVSYFSSLGYTTHALHPAESTNWRRNIVYEQLGFDSFSDMSAFEDAATLRGLTADRATYDYVLNLLTEDETPQFIFDVTIQNHGGYDVGGLDSEQMVNVPLADGSLSSELNEYVSCIRQADLDLAYLVDQLNALERPVVLCFFGDHQPGFSDWLFETTYGTTADTLGLDSVQERYSVPYMIWANEAAHNTGVASNLDAESTRTTVDMVAESRTSLNYLGTKVAAITGQPLSSYQRFLLAVREVMPAINLNGFLTADGIWHWFGEDTEANDAMGAYAAVQYDNLFNKTERSAQWVAS